MRKYCLFFLISIISFTLKAQNIQFETDSLPVVLKKAKAENKLIFVAVMPPKPSGGYSAAMMALEKLPVGQFFNAHVLSYVTTFGSTEGDKFREKYAIVNFPTFLYIDGNNNPVYRSAGSSGYFPQRYLDDANIAFSQYSSGRTMSWYQAELDSGRVTSDLIKAYIIECHKMGITDTHELIDQYAKLQTVSSFNSFEQVLFVLEAGPLLQSTAYQMAYLNKKIVDSIYKTLPGPRRAAINNSIIKNSLREAVLKKDAALAMQVANFTRNSYSSKEAQVGQRAYYASLLNYYKAIKDTAQSLQQLIRLTDTYYLNMSQEDLQKMQARRIDSSKANYQRMITALPPHDTSSVGMIRQILASVPPDSAIAIAKRMKLTSVDDTAGMKRIRMSTMPMMIPPGNPNALILNNNAWELYLSGTKNPNYLTRAMIWTNRAIDLEPVTPAYHDTLAHILYQLHLYEEARIAQEKAISLSEEQHLSTVNMKNELRKMMGRTL